MVEQQSSDPANMAKFDYKGCSREMIHSFSDEDYEFRDSRTQQAREEQKFKRQKSEIRLSD